MAYVKGVKQITHNRFLNYYELDTVKKTGRNGRYFMASRAENEAQLDLETGSNHPDGVVIFSLFGEKMDRVVLVRQFRYPIGTYIYELPAGLIEKDEDYRSSAVREMKEETGLHFQPLEADPMYERPFYNTVGMTDESCSMVFGTCTGKVDLSGLEESEELEVVLADRGEAVRILREERVAANCAYMLMHFICDREDPFAFLHPQV